MIDKLAHREVGENDDQDLKSNEFALCLEEPVDEDAGLLIKEIAKYLYGDDHGVTTRIDDIDKNRIIIDVGDKERSVELATKYLEIITIKDPELTRKILMSVIKRKGMN